MPIKGECWSCGDEAYLYCKLLYNNIEKRVEAHMVCAICKKYFEQKGAIDDDNQ